MGMGHVPKDPIHSIGESAQFQRRERRRTSFRRHSRSESLASQRLARARWAEERAAAWYRAHGFDVVAMNWTMRGGEIDVVARRGRLVVICEVKARSTLAYGTPLEAMTQTKQERVRRAGYEFVRRLNERGIQIRFDIATVLGITLTIYEDAF